MERIKELLVSTNMKLGQIAECRRLLGSEIHEPYFPGRGKEMLPHGITRKNAYFRQKKDLKKLLLSKKIYACLPGNNHI